MNIYRNVVLAGLMSAMLVGCVTPISSSTFGNRATLSQLNAHLSAPKLKVEQPNGIYRIGDPIRFRVTSAQTGQLWVVQIDPADNVTLLYPTATNTDNRISANLATDLPNASWQREWLAGQPMGESQVAFIVTPLNKTLDDVMQIRNNRLVKTAYAKDASWSMEKLTLRVQQ